MIENRSKTLHYAEETFIETVTFYYTQSNIVHLLIIKFHFQIQLTNSISCFQKCIYLNQTGDLVCTDQQQSLFNVNRKFVNKSRTAIFEY